MRDVNRHVLLYNIQYYSPILLHQYFAGRGPGAVVKAACLESHRLRVRTHSGLQV